MFPSREVGSVRRACTPQSHVARPWTWCAGLATVALCALGCTTTKDAAVPVVRVRAAEDLECDSTKIEVHAEMGGRYRAIGCGRTKVYSTVCEHLQCRVADEETSAPAWRDRPDPGSVFDGR